MDYAKMQIEHAEWLSRMYPHQLADIPAAGMVEEAAELLHAILKQTQARVYGNDRRNGNLDEKLVDAIGDCAIFVCSYCNARNWPYTDFIGATPIPQHFTPLQLAVQLVRVAANNAITASAFGLTEYVVTLKSIAEMHDINFDDAVAKTWAIVRLRTICS